MGDLSIIINKALSNCAHISAITRSPDLPTILERLSDRQWSRVITLDKNEGLSLFRTLDPRVIESFSREFKKRLWKENCKLNSQLAPQGATDDDSKAAKRAYAREWRLRKIAENK